MDMYRLTKKGLDKALKLKVGAEVIASLRSVEGRSSTSRDKFSNFLKDFLKAAKVEVSEKEIETLCNVSKDPWSVRTFNLMDFGEVHNLSAGLQVRRITGGWSYEHTLEGKVLSAFFVSTDEMSRA